MFLIFFLITGICAAFIQALFFRELLAVFQGNDLIIGILFAHSVFAVSAGTFLASKIKKINASNFTPPLFLSITALLLVFSFVFILHIRDLLGISLGGGISLKSAFIYVFAAVFPVFFVQGAASFSAVKLKKDVISKKTSLLFILLGFIIGGASYTFFMYSFAGAGIVLITASLLCVASVLSADSQKKVRVFFIIALIPALFGLFANFENVDKYLLKKSFASSEIVEYKYTAYGQTALVEKNKEYSLLVNHIIQFSSPDNDILNSEDFGHIPALYCESPDNILVIGGAGKYLPMILEHEVKTVDYLEPDTAVVEIIKNNMSHLGYAFNDKRINVYNENARTFLEKHEKKYNLILIGFPTPVNLNLNRYYTKEFFYTAKKSMKKNGFIAVKLPGTMAFSTYIMAELNKSVREAMESVFKNVNIIPGSQNILIAADRRMPYRLHIKKRLYKMQETTLVLSKYYLDDRMDTERTRWLKNELDKIEDDDTLMNTDSNPQAMLLSVLHSQSAFSPYLSLFADKVRKYSYLIFIVVIIIFFLSKSLYKTTAFVSGSVSLWVFITVLFAAQIYSGEIYKMFGLLSALFVGGLMPGFVYAWNMKDSVPFNKKMFYSELLFLVWIILLLSLFKFYIINIYVLCIISFGTGFAAGMEFVQLIKISALFRENSAGDLKIYFSEMLGALFSALAGGSFLIAAWGIEKSLLFILFMKFLIFCRWADLKKRGL